MSPLFVWIARAEGLSLLVLFGVAMPLKYVGGWTHATMVPGWIHGLLFLIYVAVLGKVAVTDQWSPVRIAAAFVAAFVPFGTFVFEHQIGAQDSAD